MKLWQAIFFAILQGITEFLPVSSSGHLVLLKNVFGFKDLNNSYDVMLHVGTLAAVCLVYKKDVVRIVVEFFHICGDCIFNISTFFKNKTIEQKSIRDGVDWEFTPYRRIVKNAYRKFVVLVIVSSIPTAIIGMAQELFIEDIVVKSTLLPGIFLVITGLILMLMDRIPEGSKTPKQTTYTDALIIGTVQGFATLPGISRSGSTITAGIACGLRRDFAIKYSFIMSIPAILGAALIKLVKIGDDKLTSTELGYYAIGMVIAALVGFIFINLLINIIKKRGVVIFAYYCFAIGAIAIISNYF